VSCDDRTADRQPHAHTVLLRREEGLEQPVGVLGRDPDTTILHCYKYLVCVVLVRSDQQFARPIRDRLHRLDPIDYQIDYHLLQLVTYPSGHSGRKRRRGPKFMLQSRGLRMSLYAGNKQPSDVAPMPGVQEGKPIQPGKARGALKELFLLAAENVGDRLKNRKKVGAEKEQKLYRNFRVSRTCDVTYATARRGATQAM
jgi:hypothetical protein